jgi:hypothetical protein
VCPEAIRSKTRNFDENGAIILTDFDKARKLIKNGKISIDT